MNGVNPAVKPDGIQLREHEIDIRVRYQETDAQGRVHHANYINYFEVGRVEFLRAAGFDYRQMEAEGIYLVVKEIECEYFFGACYDDVLRLRTTVVRSRGVRVVHDYRLTLEGEMVARGRSVVASVSPQGKVVRLPDWLQIKEVRS